MEAVLQWGLDCVRLIQTWSSPPLNILMRIITELGSVTAYLVLLPLIYWCIDEKKGLRLGIAALFSTWINLVLKFALDQPRPFFAGYDPSVGMIAEKLGGFPSGHAQNSLVMWLIIASWGNRKRHWCAAAFFCLLIGFSRVYLGVHFPTDVAGGWLIGGILLTVYFLAGKRLESMISAQGPRAGLIICAALSFVMILYRPSAELLMPPAMLLGLGGGYYLCKQRVGFTASVSAGKAGTKGAAKYLILLVRFLLGLTVLALLYVITEKVIAGMNNSANYQLVIFLRFSALALWVSAGAPWLFRFMRLAAGTGENG
ncbi:MAG: phosphatase PAP2 family protein [Treponema sp.]|jgi:membrane-associated phospholipid phosphatase|nr:phosphatase PAP2 family protein [Treponema sp.]